MSVDVRYCCFVVHFCSQTKPHPSHRFMNHGCLYALCLQAVDLSKPIDKRIYKGTQPTCHDFNQYSATAESVALIVGFSAGQVQYLDPIKKETSKLFNEEVFYFCLHILVSSVLGEVDGVAVLCVVAIKACRIYEQFFILCMDCFCPS